MFARRCSEDSAGVIVYRPLGPSRHLVVLERCNRWAGTTNDVTTSKDALKRIQLPVSSWRMIRRKSRENKGGVIY